MAQWLKAWVWFPASKSGSSQLPVTSALRDLIPLQATAFTYTYPDTDIITGCRQSKALDPIWVQFVTLNTGFFMLPDE